MTTMIREYPAAYYRAPSAFNPEYRPGLAGLITRVYGRFCEMNPNATKEERKRAHMEIREGWLSRYPKVGN